MSAPSSANAWPRHPDHGARTKHKLQTTSAQRQREEEREKEKEEEREGRRKQRTRERQRKRRGRRKKDKEGGRGEEGGEREGGREGEGAAPSLLYNKKTVQGEAHQSKRSREAVSDREPIIRSGDKRKVQSAVVGDKHQQQ